jgi:hypothetical protein
MDERFDYARKQLNDAAWSAAEHIVWVIARETGKNIGSDKAAERERDKLAQAIDSFLKG